MRQLVGGNASLDSQAAICAHRARMLRSEQRERDRRRAYSLVGCGPPALDSQAATCAHRARMLRSEQRERRGTRAYSLVGCGRSPRYSVACAHHAWMSSPDPRPWTLQPIAGVQWPCWRSSLYVSQRGTAKTSPFAGNRVRRRPVRGAPHKRRDRLAGKSEIFLGRLGLSDWIAN